MFTACTMASAVEALGMVVPGTASHPAVTAENSLTDQKKRDCVDSVSNVLQSQLHCSWLILAFRVKSCRVNFDIRLL